MCPRTRFAYRLRIEGLEERRLLAAFNPADVAELIAAITVANGNGESDTIELGGTTFRLTVADNNTDGGNGLPSILPDGGNSLFHRVDDDCGKHGRGQHGVR